MTKCQALCLSLICISHLIFFFNLFYSWLCWVFTATLGLSLVAAIGGGGSPLFAVHKLLIAGASLVAEHGL